MTGDGANFKKVLGKKVTALRAANYWVANDITVPSRLSELLATAYGLPPTQNVPLRLDTVDAKGSRRMLETYRMEQSAIPVSYFTCPTGYKQVTSDAEVMMNAEQKQMIDDMTRDMPGLDSAPTQTYRAPATPAATPAATGGGANDLSRLLDAFNKTEK